MDYVAYTDGSCVPQTGRGAWATILLGQNSEVVAQLSGAQDSTTSVRMEVQAAIEALRYVMTEHGIGCKVEIRSDSTYLVNGGTKWLGEWRSKGVLQNLDAPTHAQPKNIDLWRIIDAMTLGHDVSWTWIKGHANNPFNVECDRLATEARLGISGIQPNISSNARKVDHSQPLLEAVIKAVRDEAPWITITAATRIAKSVLHVVQKRDLK